MDFVAVFARWRRPAQAVSCEVAIAGAIVVELEGDFAGTIVVAFHLDEKEGLVFGGKAGVQQVVSWFRHVCGLQGRVGCFGSFFQRGADNFFLVGLFGQVRMKVLHIVRGHVICAELAKAVGVVAKVADDFEGAHLLVHKTRCGTLRTLADAGSGHVDEVSRRIRDAVACLVGSQLGILCAFFLESGVVVEGPAAVQVDVLEQLWI